MSKFPEWKSVQPLGRSAALNVLGEATARGALRIEPETQNLLARLLRDSRHRRTERVSIARVSVFDVVKCSGHIDPDELFVAAQQQKLNPLFWADVVTLRAEFLDQEPGRLRVLTSSDFLLGEGRGLVLARDLHGLWLSSYRTGDRLRANEIIIAERMP